MSTATFQSSDTISYARARLFLGISTVGLLVVASTGLLLFDVPNRLLPDGSTPLAASAGWVVAVVAVWATLLGSFDLLGGYVLPTRYGRSRQSVGGWLAGWFQGVLVQGAAVAASLLLLLSVGRAFGDGAVVATVFVLQCVLVGLQRPLAQLVGGMRSSRQPGSESTTFGNRDSGFTGGVVGWPGAERIVLPETWRSELDRPLVDLEVRRRELAIASGGRTTALFLAVLWNTLGVAAVVALPGFAVDSVAGLVEVVLAFGLFQFVGLLLLPALSRTATFAVDRGVVSDGTSRDDLERLVRRLDELQDGEPSRTKSLESVFHPVPCVERRLAALDADGGGSAVTWNVARTALYLSWACGGPLSRAVHCNVGRPELWVLLPY